MSYVISHPDLFKKTKQPADTPRPIIGIIEKDLGT